MGTLSGFPCTRWDESVSTALAWVANDDGQKHVRAANFGPFQDLWAAARPRDRLHIQLFQHSLGGMRIAVDHDDLVVFQNHPRRDMKADFAGACHSDLDRSSFLRDLGA